MDLCWIAEGTEAHPRCWRHLADLEQGRYRACSQGEGNDATRTEDEGEMKKKEVKRILAQMSDADLNENVRTLIGACREFLQGKSDSLTRERADAALMALAEQTKRLQSETKRLQSEGK